MALFSYQKISTLCVHVLFRANSQLANGQIVLREDADQKNQRLERLAFSNAMALSGNLNFFSGLFFY